MILGCGIDLVEVARIERELARRRSGDHQGAMADVARRRAPSPEGSSTGFGGATADLARVNDFVRLRPQDRQGLRRDGVIRSANDFDDVLTPAELARSQALRRPAIGCAAGFAAKEACFKALGTGKVGAMSWHDIEIGREDGQYTVALSGETAAVAKRLGVDHIHLSLTSTRAEVVALVVMCGPPSPG